MPTVRERVLLCYALEQPVSFSEQPSIQKIYAFCHHDNRRTVTLALDKSTPQITLGADLTRKLLFLCRFTLVILGFIITFLSGLVGNILMVPLGTVMAVVGILLRTRKLGS